MGQDAFTTDGGASGFTIPDLYEYESFPTRSSIRLLELLLNTPEDPASIRCKIRMVDLDAHPHTRPSRTRGASRGQSSLPKGCLMILGFHFSSTAMESALRRPKTVTRV